jgi:hypothetical protein
MRYRRTVALAGLGPSLSFALLTGLFLWAGPKKASAASIAFETETLSVVVQPDQSQATGEFSFRNVGDHSVSVASIKPSCSCVAAHSPQRSYAPGESGKINVVYTSSDRGGADEKTISVMTDEPGSAPTVLTLKAHILRYLSVEPRLLNWAIGGDNSELRIRCEVGSSRAVYLTGVNCSLPGITATIDTVDVGRKYVVKLRSAPRQSHDTALITVTANIEGVGSRQYPVYAYFR